MKRALLCYLSLLCCLWGYGQSLDQKVVSPAGDHFTGTTAQLSWTIGEPVSATFSGTNATLTQGFHQTNLMITALEDLAADFRVKVYPNPTADRVQVEAPDAPAPFSLELTDAKGRLLLAQPTEAAYGTRSLDLSGLAAGWYLLRLRTADQRTIKTFKIVKSN